MSANRKRTVGNVVNSDTAAERFWKQPVLMDALKGLRRVLLGVSGGADSTALLWLMTRPVQPADAPELLVAHVHHGLRGAEADADLEAVKRNCKALGVKFYSRGLSAAKLRATKGGSLENVMREARYAALRSVYKARGAEALLLAHHMDDAAETLLMRLMRGSGLAGLAGMAPRSELFGMSVLRPLLEWRRAELREVARASGLEWADDRSNEDLAHFRNRVRARVLPVLDEASDHGPAAPVLARTSRVLAADFAALEEWTRGTYEAWRLSKDKPPRLGLPLQVLLERNAVFAPQLIRRLWAELGGDARPPDSARVDEMIEFLRTARHRALFQTALNTILYIDDAGVVWFYRKPRRLMSAEEIRAELLKP
jgi:tRNA(Ile)-lysidine synthase